MNVLVRRYKRDNDKAALYIFANSEGVEMAYVYCERVGGVDRIESMDSTHAANQLTHNLGLGGFMPDGKEELLEMWALASSEELGEAPTGRLDSEPEVEAWDDGDFSEGDLPPLT